MIFFLFCVVAFVASYAALVLFEYSDMALLLGVIGLLVGLVGVVAELQGLVL